MVLAGFGRHFLRIRPPVWAELASRNGHKLRGLEPLFRAAQRRISRVIADGILTGSGVREDRYFHRVLR